jgi:hypothetical protein
MNSRKDGGNKKMSYVRGKLHGRTGQYHRNRRLHTGRNVSHRRKLSKQVRHFICHNPCSAVNEIVMVLMMCRSYMRNICIGELCWTHNQPLLLFLSTFLISIYLMPPSLLANRCSLVRIAFISESWLYRTILMTMAQLLTTHPTP